MGILSASRIRDNLYVHRGRLSLPELPWSDLAPLNCAPPWPDMELDKELLPVLTCVTQRADRQPRLTGTSDVSRPGRSRPASARAFLFRAAVLPTLFFVVAILPVDVLGSVARSLLALGLAVPDAAMPFMA